MYSLRKIYKETDEAIKNANCLTQLANIIREVFISLFYTYAPRFHIAPPGQMDFLFRGYTEENFKKNFGEKKKKGFDNDHNVVIETDEYLHSDGRSDLPLRIIATENAIRALLQKKV